MKVIPAQGVAPGAESAHVLLRKARPETGLSQSEVERHLGMDVLEYCRLESGCGEIDFELVQKITEDIEHKEPAS